MLGKPQRASRSISEARQRVGCRVMTRLFEKLARAYSKQGNPISFFERTTMDGN
jgi:hypothetical protein